MSIGKSGGKGDMKRGQTRLYRKYTKLASVFKLPHGFECHGRLKMANGYFCNFEGHYVEVDDYFLIKIDGGKIYAKTGGGFLHFDILEFHFGVC